MLPKINIVAFILGHKNIAQCFRCGNSIHWKEGQDPLDEAFHSNCTYLRQISNTQVIYCTQIKKATSEK
jgi:late competence protein required for DNA uptake (superfamily II DNA/RNA helicase)